MKKLLTLLIVVVVLLIALITVNKALNSGTKVSVSLDGAENFSVLDSQNNKILDTTNHDKVVKLMAGSYIIRFDNSRGDAVKIDPITVANHGSRQVSGASKNGALSPAIVSATNADWVTPLAGGYLYVDKSDRGVKYLDQQGISTDLSPDFGLGQTPLDSNNPVDDTVVSIYATSNGGAVVTTTMGVYTIDQSLQVQSLSLAAINVNNFNASSYDASDNKLYLLRSNSNQVYRYDLDNIDQDPTVVFTDKKQINQITAGGGKILVYYNAVPNLNPSVLSVFAEQHQIEPQLVSLPSGKVTTIADYPIVTNSALSSDGRFAAFQSKFSDSLYSYSTTNHTSSVVGAADTSAISWQGSSLYFGYGGSVYSYDASTQATSPTLVSETGVPLTYIKALSNHVVAETNNGLLLNLNTSGSNRIIDSLRQVSPPVQTINSPTYQYFAVSTAQ